MGLGIEGESVVKGFGGGCGWGVVAKPCDSCKTGPAAVYCRPDSAFLCLTCDAKIHCANKLSSRHDRVWMCEVCEQAPAVVMCKADAAALCVTCDADIHSANPLARRHERVPVEPFFDTAESVVKASSSVFNFLLPAETNVSGCDGGHHHHEEVEVASWLLSNPPFNSKLVDGPEIKSGAGGDIFFTENEMDSFIDFDYPNPVNQSAINDSVVPVQTKPLSTPVISHSHSPENCFDIDFCRSKLNSFGYQSQSLSHSVSSSSLEVGVVPEGNSMSDISYPMGQTGGDSGLAMSGSGNQATQLCGMDREARVLRYREKRKNRKFEKTIRYASRKAYAETRPRIKGRFAKRSDTLTEVEEMYGSGGSSMFLSEAQYGVVPTF